MKIYILRHGIAEDYHPQGDPSRELTGDGIKKIKALAQFFKGKINPGLILTSPYVRAVQTATAAAGAWNKKKDIEYSEALFPGSESEDIIPELKAWGGTEVVLVGHNPHLSYLVSDFISGGKANIQLKKASLTCVEFEGSPRLGGGLLKWMITPGMLGL